MLGNINIKSGTIETRTDRHKQKKQRERWWEGGKGREENASHKDQICIRQ